MKNKFLSIILGALTLATVSCKKDLDLQPTDTFSENNAFLTMTDLQYGANEAYGRYGTYVNDMYVSALVADEAKLGFDNSGQGALTYRYQYASDGTSGGDVTAAWGGYYSLIDQTNRVLSKVDVVKGDASEEPKRNIIKGQMLAMRAIGHFGVLQAYCKNYDAADPKGVPVMLSSNPVAKPARKSMGEAMAQIEADLAEAKTLLSDPSITFSDTAINKVNIAAFQARIALYKRDYDAAINFATEVITAGATSLASAGQFPGIWTDDNIFDEVLFRVRYATGTTVGGIWTTTGGNVYIAPSDKLVASYSSDDIRLSTYIGNDGGKVFVNKFYTSSRGGRVVDLKAIRIAEMYLIRAEAHAKKANPDVAAGTNDLNELRRNRITGYTDVSFPSATSLAAAVLDERFKELAFEGFRFYDLKRNNLPVERLASDASPEWGTLPAGNYRFVLPIPNSELLANGNMVQNDGY